jgi:uncharacterized phage-like protein YoqJ
MENKTKICMFTGHRIINARHISTLPHRLDDLLEQLIAHGYTEFRAGGAIGFDTVAALKVLERREHDPSLSLELCLPCRDQTHGWDARSREYYEYILTHADRVSYVQEAYTKGCMLARNRMLVDGSQFCIGYCTSERGGSAYTLDYAKKKGLRVINLARMLPNT